MAAAAAATAVAAAAAAPNIAVSSAHKPNVFSGLSSENGSEFLRQFELYCRIHRLVLVEPVTIPPATQPACYRFQACISGDAARWFSSLPAANTATWPDIRAAFVAKYCNDWTENVSLKAIRQKAGKPVKAYAGRFYTQIRRMGKHPDDFVSGLLPELRSQVFMMRPANADNVIQYAKLAELCQIKKNAEEIAAVESSEEVLQTKDPIEKKAHLLSLDEGLKEIKESLAALSKSQLNTSPEEIQAFQGNNNNSQRYNNNNNNSQRNQGSNSGNLTNENNRNNQQRRNNGNRNHGRPRFNNQRFNGNCHNCGIYGHRARDYHKSRNSNYQNGGYNQQNQNFDRHPHNQGNDSGNSQQGQNRSQTPVNVIMPPRYSGHASNYPPHGQQRMMMMGTYTGHPPVCLRSGTLLVRMSNP